MHQAFMEEMTRQRHAELLGEAERFRLAGKAKAHKRARTESPARKFRWTGRLLRRPAIAG